MQQLNTARSNNFLFVVGNTKTTYSVQSTTIGDINLGETSFETRDKDLYLPSDKLITEPFTITILCSEDYQEWVEMYKWMLECKNTTINYFPTKSKPCELTVLDSQNVPSTRFIYDMCFPTDISGVQLSILDESNVLTFDLTVRYNDLTITTKDGITIGPDYTGD